VSAEALYRRDSEVALVDEWLRNLGERGRALLVRGDRGIGKTALRVDFGNPDRAPLLLIAGGADHIVPAAVDASAARHHAKSPAVTAYRSFPGRSHYTIGEPGWEEVADYALSWAVENATVRTTA
jgi:alpha-beta hydrolase superfamily lysophospholipase